MQTHSQPHIQTLSTNYPKFKLLTPTGIPRDKQPKGHPNTRFNLVVSKDLWLFKDFHKKKLFYAPAEMIDIDGSKAKNLFDTKRSKQIIMIMRTVVINSNECWIWAGAKRGGYPSVAFNGKMRGAMKTLLYWLTNHLMDEVGVNKLCDTDFCINPAHYLFTNFPFNIPKDPELMAHAMGISTEGDEERFFWTTDEVLPWQHINNGIKTLFSQEELKIITPKPQIMQAETKNVEQAMAPTAADDYRTFFKISKPKSSEAANNANEGKQENS